MFWKKFFMFITIDLFKILSHRSQINVQHSSFEQDLFSWWRYWEFRSNHIRILSSLLLPRKKFADQFLLTTFLSILKCNFGIDLYFANSVITKWVTFGFIKIVYVLSLFQGVFQVHWILFIASSKIKQMKSYILAINQNWWCMIKQYPVVLYHSS